MCVEITDPRFAHHEPVAGDLSELSTDIKRMLKVQWKEFLHWLDEKGGSTSEEQSDYRLRQQLEPAIYASTIAFRHLDLRHG